MHTTTNMRRYTSTLLLLALPAARAVSLADFTPRPTHLPPACQAIYLEPINGCSASDWPQSQSVDGCSQGCVEALGALATRINTACANKGVTGQNIIVAFLDGQGPQSICSNANDYLAAGGAGTPSSRSATSSPSSSVKTSNAAKPQSTTALSGTATASSLASAAATSGIIIDGASQPKGSSTSSSETSSQTNMANSGGGSPFDTGANISSGTHIPLHSFMLTFFTTMMVFGVATR